MTRIPPLPREQWTDEQLRVMLNTSGTDEPAGGNWYGALVRHPKLHAKWLAFGSQLLVRGVLPERDRELAVLRTAWLTSATYYWEPHVQLALEAGLTRQETAAVIDGPDAPGWDAHDRAVLSSVDALLAHHVIPDEVWATLAASYDQQQLIELPFLIGHYVMVAYVMRSIGVELDEEVGP